MCEEGVATVEDLSGFFVDLAACMEDFGVYGCIVEGFGD